jgi:hypothetical protein
MTVLLSDDGLYFNPVLAAINNYIIISCCSTDSEVVATSTFEIISRDAVEDLIFIIPLTEIENGN